MIIIDHLRDTGCHRHRCLLRWQHFLSGKSLQQTQEPVNRSGNISDQHFEKVSHERKGYILTHQHYPQKRNRYHQHNNTDDLHIPAKDTILRHVFQFPVLLQIFYHPLKGHTPEMTGNTDSRKYDPIEAQEHLLV